MQIITMTFQFPAMSRRGLARERGRHGTEASIPEFEEHLRSLVNGEIIRLAEVEESKPASKMRIKVRRRR